jgi:hypothetical protein
LTTCSIGEMIGANAILFSLTCGKRMAFRLQGIFF